MIKKTKYKVISAIRPKDKINGYEVRFIISNEKDYLGENRVKEDIKRGLVTNCKIENEKIVLNSGENLKRSLWTNLLREIREDEDIVSYFKDKLDEIECVNKGKIYYERKITDEKGLGYIQYNILGVQKRVKIDNGNRIASLKNILDELSNVIELLEDDEIENRI